MEVNETRTCLVTDILLNKWSNEPISKKVEYPFKIIKPKQIIQMVRTHLK